MDLSLARRINSAKPINGNTSRNLGRQSEDALRVFSEPNRVEFLMAGLNSGPLIL